MKDINGISCERLIRFDNYDLFGFIVPGALFGVGIYLHTKLFLSSPFNQEMVDFFSSIGLGSQGGVEVLKTSLFVLFSFYMLGHIVALLSSAIVDKLLIERTLGYPFHELFNKFIRLNKYTRKMKKIYKSIIVLFVLPLLYTSYNRLQEGKTFIIFVPFVILVTIKVLMTSLYLRHFNDPYSFRKKDSLQIKLAEFFWRYLLKRLLFPIVGIFDFFSKGVLSTLRMHKPFTEDFQKSFIDKFRKTFNLEPNNIDTEVYWLTYSYIYQHHPESDALIRRWLTQYSFARNLSTAFFMLFLYNLFLNDKTGTLFISWNKITLICFIIFLLRYEYLYYNYYSKYIFRTFVTMLSGSR